MERFACQFSSRYYLFGFRFQLSKLFRYQKRSDFKTPCSNDPKYLHWKLSKFLKFLFIIFSFGLKFNIKILSRKKCYGWMNYLYRKTLGPHFYPLFSIKNLQWKKVFFFLLPILIHKMNPLKWIFSNIFAFWISFKNGGFSLWHSFKVAPVVVALFQSGTWKYYSEP